MIRPPDLHRGDQPMHRRKLLLLALGVLCVALGVAASLLLRGSHDAGAAHEQAHPAIVLAALVPCWSAVLIAMSNRKRGRCRRDIGE